MKGYLGEEIVAIEETPFADYKTLDWVLYWVACYSQIDGECHKQWVLDQIARLCNGTPVVIKKAKWDNGYSEWRIMLDEPPPEYEQWVYKMRFDGEDEYEYNIGVTP